MKANDIMTTPVATCHAHQSLAAAAQLLWEHDCGAVPVVAEDGGLLGIITDRDICMAAYTRGGTLAELPIEPAMAKEVFSCTPDSDIAEVEELMRSKKIRRVPVVDGENHPIGMLSLGDLVRAAIHVGDGQAREAVMQTLAEVCEPGAVLAH